jgi:hypothetical protein
MASAHYDFTMLGPRVPTIIVSPWVMPDIVNKPEFDHTSIPRTIRQVFGIDQQLSDREEAASTFDHLVTDRNGNPRTDLPDLEDWLLTHDSLESEGDAPSTQEADDDTFTRSLDWLALTGLHYAEAIERPRRGTRDPEKRARIRAQRKARREFLRALGRAANDNRTHLDSVADKVAVAMLPREAAAALQAFADGESET